MEGFMSEQTTSTRPVFQPRPGIQGLATAYLCACLAERVVIVESGCWEQAGGDNGRGYGFIDLKHWAEWPERIVQLHRLAYRLCVGPIPDGLCVLHRCDNPPCCRPDHLFLGTNLDNIEDKIGKGRQAKGSAVRANHDHLKGEAVVTSHFTADQIMEMRQREAAGEHPATIAADFGTAPDYVVAVARGDCWTHLPLLYTGDRKNRPCPKCGTVCPTRAGIFYKHVAACKE
jgi:hypothetical protein